MKNRKGAALTATIAVVMMNAPSAAAAASACTGLSGCKVVSRADVDGDGRADQVGVRATTSAGKSRITVRVRTAKGRLMSTTMTGSVYSKHPWHGAAKIDGRAGYELVVPLSAQTESIPYRVLTYRDGRLVTLKAPTKQWVWTTDASYFRYLGWSRATSNGKVYVTYKRAWLNTTSRRYDLRTTKYQWKNGAWSKPISSTRNPRASHKTADRIAGWKIPYLKRF